MNCPECQSHVSPQAWACVQCGHPSGQKRWWIAVVLYLFLGGLGVHRFYTGHYLIGALYFFTLGLVGFGIVYDFFLFVTGSYTDASGQKLR